MSKIEWTDKTWNPVVGCSKISDGCDNCYAERMACRLAMIPSAPMEYTYVTNTWNEPIVQIPTRWTGRTAMIAAALRKPLHWRKPRRVFVCSMGDLFHESVPWAWIHRIMLTITRCPQHTFQILTKRPDRMAEYFTRLAGDPVFCVEAEKALGWDGKGHAMVMTYRGGGHLPNVWLGVTCENQQTADERIPHLLRCPASVRFVSVEPMLGPVEMEQYLCDDHYTGDLINGPCVHLPSIDWVICGGESGPGARPMHPDWARSLRDQCADAGVPFMFKQWGEWAPLRWQGNESVAGDLLCFPDGQMVKLMTSRLLAGNMKGVELLRRVGKKRAGRLLDGVGHDGYPEVHP